MSIRRAWIAACVLPCLLSAGDPVVSAGSGEETASSLPTHTVKPGETLSDISNTYYGSARHWKRIADANGISDPRRVREGWTLVIPPLTGPLPAPGGPTHAAPAPAAEGAGGTEPDVPLPDRLRDAVNRLLRGAVPWWLVLCFPVLYVIYLLAYWVGSNIVHMARMSVGAAAACALLTLLVWIGCVVLWVLLWLTVANTTGEAPDQWPVLVGAVVIGLAGMLATLIAIRLVYRDAFGKVAALWTVSLFLSAFCFNPFGLLAGWLIGG